MTKVQVIVHNCTSKEKVLNVLIRLLFSELLEQNVVKTFTIFKGKRRSSKDLINGHFLRRMSTTIIHFIFCTTGSFLHVSLINRYLYIDYILALLQQTAQSLLVFV